VLKICPNSKGPDIAEVATQVLSSKIFAIGLSLGLVFESSFLQAFNNSPKRKRGNNNFFMT
jgi:hypothetical protein